MHSTVVGVHAIHTVHSGDVVMSICRSHSIEETINIRTPAIIGRLYTETKPRRYWVMPLKGRWSTPQRPRKLRGRISGVQQQGLAAFQHAEILPKVASEREQEAASKNRTLYPIIKCSKILC